MSEVFGNVSIHKPTMLLQGLEVDTPSDTSAFRL